MANRTRVSRVLACSAIVGSALGATTDAKPETIIITGSRVVESSGYSFDFFMSQYFGSSGPSSTSFSYPEGEAFATVFGKWINQAITPKAAMTINVCAMPKATASTRSITKNSEPIERQVAAGQMYFDSLPNFINLKKNGLVIAFVFADGSQELYTHTTFAGLQPVANTFVPGTGVSACAA